MNKGKTIFIAIAAAGLIARQGGSVSAQEEQGNTETSIQTQDSGQTPAAGQMRKGYPGYRLRNLDEKQKAPDGQKNRITLFIEDERQQLKALNEDRGLSIEQKKEKVRQIREAAHDKIKAILPPEEQKKYEKSRENDRQFRDAMRKRKAEMSGNNGE